MKQVQFSKDVLVSTQLWLLHLIVHQLTVHQFQILVLLQENRQFLGQLIFLRLLLIVLLEQLCYWVAQHLHVLHLGLLCLLLAAILYAWFNLDSLLFHRIFDSFFMLLIKNISHHLYIILKFLQQGLNVIRIDNGVLSLELGDIRG